MSLSSSPVPGVRIDVLEYRILICVVTDVLPALSMVYEKPEADLLLRKPRNRQKDRLADGKLLCQAYFLLGFIETLTSMSSYVSPPPPTEGMI